MSEAEKIFRLIEALEAEDATQYIDGYDLKKAATLIRRLSTENAAQAERIAKLEEALKPFAELPPYPPAHRKLLIVDASGPYHVLQLDFDRARAALGGDNG
jgi:hypothetical protein